MTFNFIRKGPVRRGLLTKTCLVMKMTATIFLLTFLHVNAETFSQKVTLSVKNTTLQKVFPEITRQTGISIFYREDSMEGTTKVTIDAKNVSIQQILDLCVRNQPISYAIDGNHIIIKRTDIIPTQASGNQLLPDTAITLTGKVIDAGTNTPLEGVTVSLSGTNIGAATNRNGVFLINTHNVSSPVLEFSIVGYETQQHNFSGKNNLTISLRTSTSALGEVVVIGYGTVEKKDLTGSVSSLKSAEIDKGVNMSVDQMMQGRAPGVRVTQSSSEPGGGVTVRIRGANSITAGNEPLYVIDGLPVSNDPAPGSAVQSNEAPRNPLNALNPGDIETIDILKDASATAIYGSRGANGVIIITTKKGKKGGMKVGYNSYAGIQNVAKRLDMMDGQQYMNYLNDLRADENQTPLFTDQEIAAVGTGTDWQNEIFRSAPVHNHQLSFSGGSANTQYYMSLNYMNQKGVVISSGAERYTARVNINHSMNRFNFGVNLNTSLIKDDFVPSGTGINAGAGVIATALQMDPTLPVKNADGSYAQSSVVDVDNPVAIANTIYDDAETNRTFGTIYAEYKITDHLKTKLNFGSDRQSSRRDSYVTKITRRGQLSNGAANINEEDRSNYLAELTLAYSREFSDKHRVNAVTGVTYQSFQGRGFTASGQNFPTDAYMTNNIAAASPEKYVIGSGRFQNQLLSYLARVNYTIMDRYLITASFRADGSSRFGEDNKYGYFPSLALAWKITDEPFMANSRVFSDLKLRGSYGVTGNQDIGNYQSQVLLGTTGSAIFNGVRYTGIAPTQLGNNNLKWETTSQFNAGFDYGLFNNRITGTFDFFVKNTSDLLLSLPIPFTTGFATSLQNVGNTRNSGIEFVIESKNLVGKFGWTTGFNIGTVRNKVTSLGSLKDILQGGLRFIDQFTILRVGQPINSYYGYQVDGIFQDADEIARSAQPTAKPGQMKVFDRDGSGAITADDRVILGDPYPDFYFGLNNDFSYKGFDLSVFFEAVYGQDLLNFNRTDSEFPIEFRRNRMAYVLDRWTPDNASSANPSFVGYTRPMNSRVVEDASYLRLKNVQLSYSFPGLKSKWISSLSVFATAQNLITFTDYSGFNPDVNTLGTQNLRVDYNAYPLARIYTFGINLGL